MNLLAHRNLKRALILTFALVIFAFNSNGDNVSAETTILEGIALKDRTHVYESTNRNSKSLKSYREGSILLYQPHSTNWYKATVFVNGNRQTGYIHASDVETATTGGATLQGIALKNSTKVYSRGSKNASSPRSYSQGRLLYYEAYTSEWYKGFIISNGSRQNVYIHVDDVETKVDQQESLRGVASKDRTNIYSRASKNSSTLKSYAQGSVLLYKTFTSEWYEAIVFVNGKRTTGYIHKDDVENIINEQVQLNGVAKETVNVYSSASRNSSTLKSYRTGSSLIYKTYSTNWYEAIVFVNGKRTTGYIHRDDVENKQYDPRHLNGIATKNRTNVYQGPSSNSSVLRSYPEGRVLM